MKTKKAETVIILFHLTMRAVLFFCLTTLFSISVLSAKGPTLRLEVLNLAAKSAFEPVIYQPANLPVASSPFIRIAHPTTAAVEDDDDAARGEYDNLN